MTNPTTPFPGEGSQMKRVLDALSEMPGIPMTANELALDLGYTVVVCSSYACSLRKRNLVQSRPAQREGFTGRRLEYWVGELI